MYEQPGAYPPPQPPQPGGSGGAIALTLKYHPLAFMFGLFKPVVELNGHQVANAWGRQVIPAAPGQYHLHVHVPYLLPSRIGRADLAVNLFPGQTAELEYRAPMIAFIGGALGTPPQKYPGMVFTVILMVFALVVVLCLCGGSVVAALNGSTSSASGLAAADAVQQVLTALRR